MANLQGASEAAETVVVPVQLADGKLLQVEARRLGSKATRPAPDESEVSGASASEGGENGNPFYAEENVAFAMPTVSDALAGVEGLAKELAQVLDRVSPTSATVEFEVELAMAAGQLTSLLVKGDGKASFKITLTWNRASVGA